MKITSTASLFLLLSTAVNTLSIPHADVIVRNPEHSSDLSEIPDLEKRRGGGGRGGGGGGGSSGGGSGGRTGSSSSGSSGGRGGSSGGSSGDSSRTSSSSNAGGATRAGSGRQPAYGGGSYYAGGARTPYTAGRASPLGVAPFILPVAALAFFPGIWLYGAYAYPYGHRYNYTDEKSNHESMPVVCLCEKYSECGCDENSNSTYYESLFNGTQPANSSVVKVANVNGTDTIYINGTLPNGTTSADSSASTDSAAATTMIQASGYWVMIALVASTVWGL